MLAGVDALATESVDLVNANGRVLREDVLATRYQPPFDVSAMDGWAVRKADLPGDLAIVGESAAGRGWSGTLGRGETVRIFTGAAVPAGADWVVIQEEATRVDDRVQSTRPALPALSARAAATSSSGDPLLTAGTRLDPWRIALAAGAGRASLTVSARPARGDFRHRRRARRAGRRTRPWQIHDSAGPGLAAWFETRGCTVILLATLPDDRAAVSAALARRVRPAGDHRRRVGRRP